MATRSWLNKEGIDDPVSNDPGELHYCAWSPPPNAVKNRHFIVEAKREEIGKEREGKNGSLAPSPNPKIQ